MGSVVSYLLGLSLNPLSSPGSSVKVSWSASPCFHCWRWPMLLGQPSGRLQKHEEQKPVLSNRLLQDSVIILKRGLFMKESQIRKQSIKPRHVHAWAQLGSLHLSPNNGQLHGNICGHVVLMALRADTDRLSLDYCIHSFNLYIIKWVHGAARESQSKWEPIRS